MFDCTTDQDSARFTVSQPSLPDDARWNAERQEVEFRVEIGEYRSVVRVPRRVFQRLLPERPTPERCVEAYHLQRTRFESIAQRKLRRRQLIGTGTWRSAGGTCARCRKRSFEAACGPHRANFFFASDDAHRYYWNFAEFRNCHSLRFFSGRSCEWYG